MRTDGDDHIVEARLTPATVGRSREICAAAAGPRQRAGPGTVVTSWSAAAELPVRHPVAIGARGARCTALGDQLTALPGGKLYDVPDAPLPPEDALAPPRLLPMWDNALLAYADRARLIPPEYRKVVIRMNGDVLPTELVDGYVAGVWRTVPAGVEVTAFRTLPAAAWEALASEAAALSAFLADRDPLVYARYSQWWEKPLPAAEVRLLPGCPSACQR